MTAEWVCTDALPWLEARAGACGAIVTSPPDANEIGLGLEAYTEWLRRAVSLCFGAATPGCPVIFYVTDRLHDGRWLSKPALIARVMQWHSPVAVELLWHKVVLRREVGRTDLHRPTYAHLLAYGDEHCRPGPRTPDVIAPSRSSYSNGTPRLAVLRAVGHVQHHAHVGQLTDPFCGQGAIPQFAAEAGMQATGVDIDPAMIAACNPPQEVLL
jgi:hypothetical protein